MTTPERETAKRIARKVCPDGWSTAPLPEGEHDRLVDAIEAALLAAKAEEREACANVARRGSDVARGWVENGCHDERVNAILYSALREGQEIERAIRARGAPAAVKEEQGS